MKLLEKPIDSMNRCGYPLSIYIAETISIVSKKSNCYSHYIIKDMYKKSK